MKNQKLENKVQELKENLVNKQSISVDLSKATHSYDNDILKDIHITDLVDVKEINDDELYPVAESLITEKDIDKNLNIDTDLSDVSLQTNDPHFMQKKLQDKKEEIIHAASGGELFDHLSSLSTVLNNCFNRSNNNEVLNFVHKLQELSSLAISYLKK